MVNNWLLVCFSSCHQFLNKIILKRPYFYSDVTMVALASLNHGKVSDLMWIIALLLCFEVF